jgi:hypothetical protein
MVAAVLLHWLIHACCFLRIQVNQDKIKSRVVAMKAARLS